VRTLKPKSPQIRTAHIDTEEESSDEEQVELVAVVPVADSSDRTITAETTELEDPRYNAVADSESDGDALSQETDEIDANETYSEVTCKSASAEKSYDETPEEHTVIFRFRRNSVKVKQTKKAISLDEFRHLGSFQVSCGDSSKYVRLASKGSLYYITSKNWPISKFPGRLYYSSEKRRHFSAGESRLNLFSCFLFICSISIW
jgi:hypothetical protein